MIGYRILNVNLSHFETCSHKIIVQYYCAICSVNNIAQYFIRQCYYKHFGLNKAAYILRKYYCKLF